MIEESIDRLAQAVRDLTNVLEAQGVGGAQTAAPATTTAAPPATGGRRQPAKPADKAAENKSPVPATNAGGAATGQGVDALHAAQKEIQGLMKDLARDQIDSILGKHAPGGRLSAASLEQCALIKADALDVINGTGEGTDDPLAI